MSAGFGRDDVDGGAGTDIISLDSVLSQADVDDIASWLTLDAPAMNYSAAVPGEISFVDASGNSISASGIAYTAII